MKKLFCSCALISCILACRNDINSEKEFVVFQPPSIDINKLDRIDSLCLVFSNSNPEDTLRTNKLKILLDIYFSKQTSIEEINRIESVFIGQSYYYSILSFSTFDSWFIEEKVRDLRKYNDATSLIRLCRILTILSQKSKAIDTRYSVIVDTILKQLEKSDLKNEELLSFSVKPKIPLEFHLKKDELGSPLLNSMYIQAVRNLSDSNCANFVFNYKYALAYIQNEKLGKRGGQHNRSPDDAADKSNVEPLNK